MHHHHRTDACDLTSDARTFQRIVQSTTQPLAVPVQSGSGLWRVDFAQASNRGGERENIIVERACMGERAGLAWIEPVHDVCPAAECAERQSTAQILAK